MVSRPLPGPGPGPAPNEDKKEAVEIQKPEWAKG